ncbi:MAG TPA: hypothetical protein VGB92_01255 [Longimicrobium sp.]|jgi:hypothetical protein
MRIPLALALLALPAALAAQAPAHRSLPRGDTSVTMAGEKVLLTHTVARSREGVESGLEREDGLQGTARSEFDEDLPRSYTVLWTTADTAIALQVQRRGTRLQVSGARTATVPIPRNTRWAIADLGMDEHLIPTLRTIPQGTQGVPLAVFRPYSDRWDRLTVSVLGLVGATVIQLQSESGEIGRFIVTETGDLLYGEALQLGTETLASRRIPSAGSRRDERLQDLLVLARSHAGTRPTP